MKRLLGALLLLVLTSFSACAQGTGPGSCATNTLVGNNGGGLTCLSISSKTIVGNAAGGLAALTYPELGGTFSATGNYPGSNTQPIGMQIVIGSTGTPTTNGDAPVIFQKFTNFTTAHLNPTLYVSITKAATCSNCSATAIFAEAEDLSGTSANPGAFVEGGRFQVDATVSSSTSDFNGVVCSSGTSASVTFGFLIGCEADLQQNSGTDATATFSSSSFSAGFLASCGQGANRCTAGFMTDPFDPVNFVWGVLIPASSLWSGGTAFASNASAGVGLDLGSGSWTGGAIVIPNNSAVRARNAANSANLTFIGVDTSNVTQIASGTSGLNITGPLSINTTTGVSCAAGTVNATTFTIVDGIATHC